MERLVRLPPMRRTETVNVCDTVRLRRFPDTVIDCDVVTVLVTDRDVVTLPRDALTETLAVSD